MEMVVKTGAIRCVNLQSNCHRQHTNTQLFTGLMPFLWPNHVRALEGESITFLGLAHLKPSWGSSIFVLTTKCSWLPWGSVANSLISPLIPVSMLKHQKHN